MILMQLTLQKGDHSPSEGIRDPNAVQLHLHLMCMHLVLRLCMSVHHWSWCWPSNQKNFHNCYIRHRPCHTILHCWIISSCIWGNTKCRNTIKWLLCQLHSVESCSNMSVVFFPWSDTLCISKHMMCGIGIFLPHGSSNDAWSFQKKMRQFAACQSIKKSHKITKNNDQQASCTLSTWHVASCSSGVSRCCGSLVLPSVLWHPASM